jgi:hypothetical protein
MTQQKTEVDPVLEEKIALDGGFEASVKEDQLSVVGRRF